MAAAITTSVECQNQVKSWRLFRSLLAFLIPTCNCTTTSSSLSDHDDFLDDHETEPQYYIPINPKPPSAATATATSTSVTGTIFGSRRGKISLCFQTHHNTNNKSILLLLLELAVPTPILAREMRSGVLRIALKVYNNNNSEYCTTTSSLLSVPAWTTYCNGRRAGYAVRRRPTEADVEALRQLGSVAVGAGVINNASGDDERDEVTYLRANFQRRRVSVGSGSGSESESFHLVDPDGSIGQELSIFFFR